MEYSIKENLISPEKTEVWNILFNLLQYYFKIAKILFLLFLFYVWFLHIDLNSW